MAIDNIMTHASSVMTVISFITFLGILWWAFSARRKDDFDEASRLPFADDADDVEQLSTVAVERHHG